MFRTSAGGMLWMDASFRFCSGNLEAAFTTAMSTGGVAMFHGSPHSTFAATHPKMWHFLVTDPEKQKLGTQMGSGSVLIYRTEKMVKRVLLWHVLCALDEDCIAPEGATRGCEFADTFKERVGSCHRYDQSALSTLLNNLFDFKVGKYALRHPKQIMRIERWPGKKRPKTC